MQSTDIQLLNQTLESQLGSVTDMVPMLYLGLGLSLLIFLVPLIISARKRSREHKAILQTAEDVHAIREILEKRGGLVSPNNNTDTIAQERATELKDDPQLPAQP